MQIQSEKIGITTGRGRWHELGGNYACGPDVIISFTKKDLLLL